MSTFGPDRCPEDDLRLQKAIVVDVLGGGVGREDAFATLIGSHEPSNVESLTKH